MVTISEVKELDELMSQVAKDSRWGVIVGNYKKLRHTDDIVEKTKLLYSVLKNLRARGYEIDKKVVVELISK